MRSCFAGVDEEDGSSWQIGVAHDGSAAESGLLHWFGQERVAPPRPGAQPPKAKSGSEWCTA